MDMTTAIIAALAAFFAAYMARELKISEFRQAWINGLRDEISDFAAKAHEWMDLYIETNPSLDQELKAEVHKKLASLKYEAYRAYRKIQMRFKPTDEAANRLLVSLENLLDPGKLHVGPNDPKGRGQYGAWRALADETILQARHLLKEEWETTKNPLARVARKVPAWVASVSAAARK
ncbi:hypothetical protein QC590_19320 [Pseudomonas putida]|uniref:hypothetical protein n=1 Tax=Pseudomonas putida TaxID=303 RepID=UPI003358F828